MSNNIDVEELIREMQGKIKDVVEEGVTMVEADAKMLAPVLSGTLKRSITHEVEQNNNITTGTVGTNVEYAVLAERRKPYLEPAIDMNITQIKEKLERVLGG